LQGEDSEQKGEGQVELLVYDTLKETFDFLLKVYFFAEVMQLWIKELAWSVLWLKIWKAPVK
jgi:hypothetical protein